jgi:hypothetical protein
MSLFNVKHGDHCAIPLRRHGRVQAHALIDKEDQGLTAPFNWYLDAVGYASATTKRWDEKRHYHHPFCVEHATEWDQHPGER